MHEGGGSCLKYLKREWNRKERRGNKDLKKGEDKLGQGVGALRKGGWNPLTNYGMTLVICLYCINYNWSEYVI